MPLTKNLHLCMILTNVLLLNELNELNELNDWIE